MGAREDLIRESVDYLCSKECAGRLAGSPEGERARAWIAAQFEALDLAPLQPGFLQSVPGVAGANVLGMMPGESDRTILVCAHYDHLGKGSGGDAYWGADDNAAGVGIMLETARLLRGTKRERSVLFCAFDAEEPPHFMDATMGSQHFVREPPLPLASIDMMICMDLMGHALGGEELADEVRSSVFVLGAEKSSGTGAIVDGVNAATSAVHVRRLGGDVIPPLSDYYAFENAHVPYLFLTCGRWKHYHAVTDTPEKLDHRKMVASADYLSALVEALSARTDRTRFDPEARDDAASLRSLRAVAAALRPQVAQVSAAEPIFDQLEHRLDSHGALDLPDRETLSSLVGTLESLLE